MSQQPPPPGPYGQPPQDPYGQQPPLPGPYAPHYGSQQGFSQPVHPGYPQYTAARKPFDLTKLLTIGAWVVLGLHGLAFLYTAVDAPDFDTGFFGSMPMLGQGMFFTGVLLVLGQWLEKQKEST